MHSHFQLHCAHILRVMKAFNENVGNAVTVVCTGTLAASSRYN